MEASEDDVSAARYHAHKKHRAAYLAQQESSHMACQNNDSPALSEEENEEDGREDAADEEYVLEADEPDLEEEESEGGDSSDNDEDYRAKRKRTAQPAMRQRHTPATHQRGAAASRAVSDDKAIAQRLQLELNGGRPRRAAAWNAVQQMRQGADSEDEEDDEDEAARPRTRPRAAPAPELSDPEDAAVRAALGLRARPRKVQQMNMAMDEPRARKRKAALRFIDNDDADLNGRRSSRNSRTAKVSYAEDVSEDSGDSEAERRAKAAKRSAGVAALASDMTEFDDEVERILTHREGPGGPAPPERDPWESREFHVKWKRWSYIHCSWDTRATLSQLGGFKRVLNYIKRCDELAAARPFLAPEEAEYQDMEAAMEADLAAQHALAERIIAQRPEPDGATKYLVKWQGLPYAECTWETVEDVFRAEGQACLDAFQARESRQLDAARSVDAQRRAFAASNARALSEQPAFLKGGQLRDYQLEGLNWLVYSWSQGNNCILADEMGLGKTVQCVAMVGFLAEVMQITGPFLVVVPLSTVPNWIREFQKWTPQLNALVYVGDSKSREVIRNFEFWTGRKQRPYKFDVLITTYELVLKDGATLGRVAWNYLMVDEAHRLKNNESSLYQELARWSFKNKLLVTGTPLQNSMRELWALLHFLEPAKFPDADAFEARHSLQHAEEVTRLHGELRPHLLRRVIKDVERSLPPKNERILRVAMTPLQKQYYKWILTRNFKEINKGSRGGGQVSLLNVITELKKCCNHPFLFESAEADWRGADDASAAERLVATSGKMVLLDKLLRRLKETGHRVLIFSQMVRVLDIISDYMRLRGLLHQRLDGSTPATQRHQAMEHFNAPGSPDFAFLLSTRAGGLGINLATADTVIIFDSDWNPQNDLQAMSRAHRIGQTETVNIYRPFARVWGQRQVISLGSVPAEYGHHLDSHRKPQLLYSLSAQIA